MSVEIVITLFFGLMVFAALQAVYCMGWLRCGQDYARPILDRWERSNDVAGKILDDNLELIDLASRALNVGDRLKELEARVEGGE